MKIKNSLIVLMLLTLSIFYTSCSTKPATPDTCFKVMDTLGNEITNAKLNEPIYFVNCGDRYVLNAVFSGVKVPYPANTVNAKTGAFSNGKPSSYGMVGSVGVIIPANSTDREGTTLYNTACKKYIYGENTSVTGAFDIVYITSNVGNNGKDVVRSAPKTVSFTVNPD